MKTKLCYMGKHLQDEKLFDVFMDEQGKERIWSKIGWCVIGHYYWGEIKGSSINLVRNPERIPDLRADDAQIQTWEVKTEIAKASYKEIQLAKRLAKNPPEFEAAIKVLRPLVKNLSFFETHSLVSSLVHRARKANSND